MQLNAPYPFHSDSESITKTPLSTINTTDIASITITFADATSAATPYLSVASLHQHAGAIHCTSIHRAPDQSVAPLGVSYITQALDVTNITAQLAHIPTADATTVATTVTTDFFAKPASTKPASRASRPRVAPIPRSFASRHATSIAISRAIPSSADADGPPGGQPYSATGPVFPSKFPNPKRARTQPSATLHPNHGQSSPSGCTSESLNPKRARTQPSATLHPNRGQSSPSRGAPLSPTPGCCALQAPAAAKP